MSERPRDSKGRFVKALEEPEPVEVEESEENTERTSDGESKVEDELIVDVDSLAMEELTAIFKKLVAPDQGHKPVPINMNADAIEREVQRYFRDCEAFFFANSVKKKAENDMPEAQERRFRVAVGCVGAEVLDRLDAVVPKDKRQSYETFKSAVETALCGRGTDDKKYFIMKLRTRMQLSGERTGEYAKNVLELAEKAGFGTSKHDQLVIVTFFVQGLANKEHAQKANNETFAKYMEAVRKVLLWEIGDESNACNMRAREQLTSG
jgi:hypothetical protein